MVPIVARKAVVPEPVALSGEVAKIAASASDGAGKTAEENQLRRTTVDPRPRVDQTRFGVISVFAVLVVTTTRVHRVHVGVPGLDLDSQ